MQVSSNIQLNGEEITLKVNSKVYPLEAVYSAAYVFLDRAYIILDGDPEKEVIVKMSLKDEAKKEFTLEKLGNEFNNELLNYADYLSRAKRTQKLREMFLQRAIITNDPAVVEKCTLSSEDFSDLKSVDDLTEDIFERPEKTEGIIKHEDKSKQ